MTEKLICERCGEEIEPEACIVEEDLFGSRYFHFYCYSEPRREEDDTSIHM